MVIDMEQGAIECRKCSSHDRGDSGTPLLLLAAGGRAGPPRKGESLVLSVLKRITNFNRDQMSVTAQTSRPQSCLEADRRTSFSVRSVATPDDFFGQEPIPFRRSQLLRQPGEMLL